MAAMNRITLNPEVIYLLAELAHRTGLPGATLRGVAAKCELGNKDDGTWRISGLEFKELLGHVKTPLAAETRKRIHFRIPEVRELSDEMDPNKFYPLKNLTADMLIKYSRGLFQETQERGCRYRISFKGVRGTMWASRWGDVEQTWHRLQNESDEAKEKLAARVQAPINSLEEIARRAAHEDVPEGCLKAPSGLIVHPDRDYRLARLAPCFKVHKDWLMSTCRDAGIVRRGQIGGKGWRCSIIKGEDVIPILRKALEKGKDTSEPYAVPEPEKVEIPPEVEVNIEPPNPEDKKPVEVYRPDTSDAALDAFRLCNLILSRCHSNVARSVVRALVKTHLRNEKVDSVGDLPSLIQKVGAEGGLPEPSTE